jgi:UDP-N-acetylmuramoyl-L-alanyl-D-glutamate--2,6-diaminopimelate ligase
LNFWNPPEHDAMATIPPRPLSTYAEALKPLLATPFDPASDPCVFRIANNSSKVAPGTLFAAIRGAKADGHRFLDDAARRGAAALVVSADYDGHLPPGLPVLRVTDSYFAWSVICETFFLRPADAFRVHTVTGTNGKTSTAYFMRHYLDKARPGAKTALVSTVCCDLGAGPSPSEHTTPDAFTLQEMFSDMKSNGVTDAVMESSSHGLHQHRSGTLRFASAAFTNLTGDHLDYHGTMENYYQAKKILFRELLAEDAPAVVNTDDPAGSRLVSELEQERPGVRILSVSLTGRPGVFCSLRKLHLAPTFSDLEFTLDGHDASLRLPLPGAFNAANCLTALCMAYATGLAFGDLLEATADMPHVPGRLQAVPLACGATGFVDYAHTDDALERVLSSLRAVLTARGRLIAVFGCGGDRDRSKRPRMGAAAARLADLAILTSDNPRSEDPLDIIREIESGIPKGTHYLVEPDREKAIGLAVQEARAGDILLVAGKGHETWQETREGKQPFSDMEILNGFRA